jgi:hypothetical protein
MTKIYAPNREARGIAAGVQFKDGVAETDDPAALRYFANAGYGIGEYKPPPGTEVVTADAREFAEPVPIGTRLRDAAVDPRPSDFLPPTNAGEADPHGPLVVAPQIHGSETGPIVAGDVHVDEPDIQEAKETAADEATFVEGDTTATPSIDRPAKSATKATWVEFAVGQGLAREEAEDLTIAEIRSRFED